MHTATVERITRPRRRTDARADWRCGWCKGFIHMEVISAMQRWVHDDKPTTSHEVLPYRVG